MKYFVTRGLAIRLVIVLAISAIASCSPFQGDAQDSQLSPPPVVQAPAPVPSNSSRATVASRARRTHHSRMHPKSSPSAVASVPRYTAPAGVSGPTRASLKLGVGEATDTT